MNKRSGRPLPEVCMMLYDSTTMPFLSVVESGGRRRAGLEDCEVSTTGSKVQSSNASPQAKTTLPEHASAQVMVLVETSQAYSC